MNTAEGPSGGLTVYILVYAAILALSGVQILTAYERIDGSQMLLRMLSIAIIQAGLAITFFMHMKSARRTLALFLLPATIFVLAMMNMIWSDSFRLLTMRPFSQ